MKILHTNFHRGWGGQSNRILKVCTGLAARGHEVSIAAPEESGLWTRGRDAGLDVLPGYRFDRGFRPVSIARDVLRMRRLLRERRYDILHTHGSQDSWSSVMAAAGVRPAPLYLRTKHNDFPIADHPLNAWLYGTVMKGIVCVSGPVRDMCLEKKYIRPERLRVVHSAVDASIYPDEPDRSIREELGVEGRFVAGCVARLRDEKGHVYLIDALPEIVRAAPDFLLLIVGSGSLAGDLQKRIDALGMSEHARLIGFRRDVPRVLQGLDLFVLPSILEGLGTAILEAQAAGLPIVASRVGGIVESVTPERTGLLVEPRDVAGIAAAVIRMYREREFARAMGRAARESVKTKFTEEALVSGTERAYEEFLAMARG